MVITFQIVKVTIGLYRAVATSSGVELAEPAHYHSLEEAIQSEASALPEEFAHFADVTYGGVTSGTQSVESLKSQSAEVANRLVAVLAAMHLSSDY